MDTKCIPLGRGSYICGSDDGELKAEAQKEIDDYRAYLDRRAAGEKLPPYREFRESQKGTAP